MPAKFLSKNQNFNPSLIVSQILLIISINYTLSIIFTIVFNSLFGLNLHIDQILSSEPIDFQNNYGYCFLMTNLATNILMIFVFVLLIDKANKILDYALTTFFFHIILTTLNSNFPINILWWIINGILLTVVTLVSEYISLKLDQKDIRLNFSTSDKV
jgi:hypothetical protein